MNEEVYELVDRLNRTMVQQVSDERRLRVHLRTMDDQERTEFCYYLVDTLSDMLPAGTTTSLERIERYVAHHIKVADWQVQMVDLMDELDEINQMSDDIFAIDED